MLQVAHEHAVQDLDMRTTDAVRPLPPPPAFLQAADGHLALAWRMVLLASQGGAHRGLNSRIAATHQRRWAHLLLTQLARRCPQVYQDAAVLALRLPMVARRMLMEVSRSGHRNRDALRRVLFPAPPFCLSNIALTVTYLLPSPHLHGRHPLTLCQ